MFKLTRFLTSHTKSWRLSLFEKVILANSIVLIGEALAGLWVTSHTLESHHYLIDTSFLVLATLIGISINVLLLRASFKPLFSLLQTIRAVSTGKTQERALILHTDAEISELAQAFNTMLDTLETTQREQAALILQAQEDERRRLALELHDESSQNLTALLVHIEILRQYVPTLSTKSLTNDAELDKGLRYLAELSQHTLENIRMLSQQLRPSVLDDLGLLASLRWLADDCRQRLQLAVDLHIEGIDDTPRERQRLKGAETALFRITQESLTNIARHAHASHVSITLSQEQQRLCLTIQDNGCGYQPLQQHQGAGIIGMRERARLLGGTLQIHSQPGCGTTVEVTLPLPLEESVEKVVYA